MKKYSQRSSAFSQPSTAADILARTFKVKHLEKKVKKFSLFVEWPQVVGEEFAAICLPVKFIRKSTLLIAAKDSVWVQELTMRKSELLSLLQARAVDTFIEDIRFIAGDPATFNQKQ